MYLAIIGSRNFHDYQMLSETIDNLITKTNINQIISGGAAGADTLAEKYANDNNIHIKKILPDYQRFGKYAPLKRNDIIVSECDILIAFWDGTSKGTNYTIKKAKQHNKLLSVICY